MSESPGQLRDVSAVRVLALATDHVFGVEAEALLVNPERGERLSLARFAMAWVMRERWGWTWHRISSSVGLKAHENALYRARRAKELAEVDKSYCERLSRLAERCPEPSLDEAAMVRAYDRTRERLHEALNLLESVGPDIERLRARMVAEHRTKGGAACG